MIYKINIIWLFCLSVLWNVSLALSRTQVKIIYETDMESDIDDAATLALLHALADNGECEILAVMHNTSDDYGVGVIDAINTYYGRPDLPIGAYQDNDAPSAHFGGQTRYAESIARDHRFSKDIIKRADVPNAVKLYNRILSKQPNRSVVIVSVGWVMNLKNLILDDQGKKLARDKIKTLVWMGGHWAPPDIDHRASMNLAGNQIIPAAYEAGKYVVDNWPTEIVFSGVEIGSMIFTGEKLKNTSSLNPVRQAFLHYKQKHKQKNWSHPSWDQTAALFAVRGKEEFWTLNTRGSPQMFLKPNVKERYLRWHTRWNTATDSPHAYLKIAADIKVIAKTIEDLMTKPP